MFITHLAHLSPLAFTGVVLWDLVNWEVADVSVRLELGFEGGANTTKLVPYDTAEKGVGFDFMRAVLAGVATETILDVAKHADEGWSVQDCKKKGLLKQGI